MNDSISDPFDTATAISTMQADIAAASAQAELQRQVDATVIEQIRQSGLSSLLSPKRFGGKELPPGHHILSCMDLAQSCSAASWVHMVCGAHSFVVGRFGADCQQEVFGEDPNVLIPGTLAPQGVATRVDGGWRLSGRWQFGSAVDHGPWLLMGARANDEAGGRLPPIHLVLPTADITVDDTWFTLGMRATGSKDLVAENVFVPAHRAMPTIPLFRGDFAGDVGPLYRLPVTGGLSSMLAATVVGIARSGLKHFIESTRVRRDVYIGGSKAERAGIQLRLTEAIGEIDHAESLVRKNAALLDQAMADNLLPMAIEDVAAIRWNAAYAVELCRRATERVFVVAGAGACYDNSPIQRWFRDINTACHHAIVDFDSISEARGRLLLGLDPAPGTV